MDIRVRDRLKLGRTVLDMLRKQDFRSEFAETSPSGEHVFIPVLPDDTVGYVFDQVREAASPTYVVTRIENRVEVAMMVPARSLTAWPEAIATDTDCPVQRSSEVGMLFAYLRTQRGRRVVCIESSPALTMELVEDGSDLASR